jgi:hypothetical protein
MTAEWTTPITWTVGQKPDADDFNEQIRNNLEYLYERVGAAQLWVPVANFFQSSWGYLQSRSTFPGAPLSGADAYAEMSGICPVSYAALATAQILVIPTATQAAADWDVSVEYAAPGEAYNAHSGSDTVTTYNVTADQIYAVDIKAILASIVAGDLMGVKLTQKTAGHNVHVLGLRLTW